MKYNILVYPNITFQKHLEKDSYVIAILNIIKELSLIRNDLHWTLLLPSHVGLFDQFPNVVQKIYPIPDYPNQMRTHFDSKELLKLIDYKTNDYDIVYSHLPEHTLQLKNLFANRTNLSPVFIGYTHWTEFPVVTDYPSMMDVNFLGIVEMIRCGINTETQREMVLSHAALTYNKRFVEKLRTILHTQYLGCEVPVSGMAKPLHDELTIVFNHRANAYKGYKEFLKQMDILWDRGGNFKVWAPLDAKPDRKYVVNGHNSTRKEYFSNLRNCTIGVCFEQNHAGWSISATDGMSIGVPYLFADTPYYHELAGEAGMYYGKDGFLEAMESLIKNRDTYSKRSLKRMDELSWSKAITPFNETIQLATDNLKEIGSDSKALKEIVQFIKANGTVTKKQLLKELVWGPQISFTRYRNALRNHPHILLSESKYQYC
jgi:glycosyltransferase involved in cell wall biosynthesis